MSLANLPLQSRTTRHPCLAVAFASNHAIALNYAFAFVVPVAFVAPGFSPASCLRFELRLRFRSACCLRSESRRHNEALRIRREIIPASTRIRRGTACCARQTYLATALRISLSWPLGVLSSTRCGSSTPANVSAQAIARPTNGHLAASVAPLHSRKTFPCNRFLQTANRQPSC